MSGLRDDRRPLAAQLRDRIWEAIQEGNYRPGERLPSEEELTARFGVSRATVREALKILEEERVVVCRHGLGRFLVPDPAGSLSEEITRLKSVTEMAQGLGIATSTRVLSVREEPADERVRAHLSLEPGSTVVVLERVRSARREPIIFSIDIFPRKLVVGELQPEAFTGSLLALMEGQWGARLAYSKAVISAVMLDPLLSQRIGVPEGLPWILLEQLNYDPQDRPILFSKDYHRGDKFQFRVLRRRR
ncbi:MAG: GntR family transcriptional regulator [Anaerolineae bacterium]|nr:GntR family transcriptional regulator [Anaerolineae bacterium]